MRSKKLALSSLLTATALIVFVIESQIPSLTPIPGIKLGLSNAVTVFALYALGPGETLLILLSRIILGSLATGQVSAAMFSLAGGMLAFLLSAMLKRFFPPRRMWVLSVFGAAAHNVGQIIVAIAVTKTQGLIWYLPALIISAIITGAFTGLCAQFVFFRLEKNGFASELSSSDKRRK